jgi:hypothetical protein
VISRYWRCPLAVQHAVTEVRHVAGLQPPEQVELGVVAAHTFLLEPHPCPLRPSRIHELIDVPFAAEPELPARARRDFMMHSPFEDRIGGAPLPAGRRGLYRGWLGRDLPPGIVERA